MDNQFGGDDGFRTESIQGSSQESLTAAAAKVGFHEAGDHNLDSPEPFSRQLSESPYVIADLRNDDLAVSTPSNITTPHSAALVLSEHSVRPSRHSVSHMIEQIFSHMTDELLNERNGLTINLKARRTTSKRNAQDTSWADTAIRKICFPGRSAEEAWRFTVVTRLLELIHEALRNETVLSKRDLYYRDPALFGRQSHVDRYVDDIAFALGVSRSALNVTAAAKGLVAGALTFCRRDGSMFDAANDKEGILVPNLQEILSVDLATAKWVLVIEKEATFRAIAAPRFWEDSAIHGVIITGKGYPDLATRALLHYLSVPSPQNNFATLPVWGLVDFDPDGLAILSTYKYGSIAMAHENGDLCAPRLGWLGLRSEHLLDTDNQHATSALLNLSNRDRNKARKMLEQDILAEDGVEMIWRNELQTMLLLNVKAELQFLDSIPDGMNELLSSVLSV